VKKLLRITIISAVSLGLGAGCGIFKKKKGGGSSPLEQALENPDLDTYEGYATQKFQGSREEALQIAGQLMIDTNLNIISDGSQASGLRLQGFGAGESYDTLQTYSHVNDPSLSMLKSVRSMLCVLSKINYVSIPEGDQTVSTQIKECLPRSASASSGSSSGSSGGQSSSSSSSSSSSTSKEDLGLADITWEAYVNVDKQLIVTLKYPEKGAQEWMPSLNKEVTIVVSEGASVANPFGRYFIRIKANSDESSMMGTTAGLSLQEPVSGTKEEGSHTGGGEWYLMQAKMVVDSGTVVGGKSDQVYVAYSENSWGNDKRMAGIFDVATSTGAITKGEFVADVKGFDPESNEPGGAYRVTFNQDRLHREKTISDPTEYFGPGYQGPAISTEPVKECYKVNEFTRLVHGYRVFNADGSALNEDNQGFSFATGVEETALQGYASYWGISTYSRDGMTTTTPADGTKVYKIDWMTMSTDGKPTLGTEYTIETKPGRFQKRTKSTYDLSKLDGRVMEGYGESDPATWNWIQYKVKYNHATQSFTKVAKLSGSYDPTTGVAPTWEDLATPEAVTLSESQTYYLWSPSFTGGSLQVTNLPGEGLKATVESYEMFSGSHASKTLKCISSCPKLGVTAADLENQWNSTNFHSVDTAASAPTYTITDFSLYDSNSQAITIDFSGVATNTYMMGLYMELVDAAEYDQILAANPTYYPYQIREKASAIYNYQMGADSWSKTIILRQSNGEIATFDPPKKLDVTLSAETERFGDTTHFGESHQLQAENGFLWVPMEQKGKFKDPITGQEWDNWVPMFALKDGLLLPDTSSTLYKIKAQFIESRMNTAPEEECSTLTLPTTLDLPESVMTQQTTALRN
jgi:hypothetical protein